MNNIETRIVNVVVGARLNQSLDLSKIAELKEKGFDVEFSPEDFPGIMFRLKNPTTVLLIFASGKVVSVGTKSEEEAKWSIYRLIEILQKNEIKISNEPEILINDIVAAVNPKRRINIDCISEKFKNTVYHPEDFPGLFYRMQDPKVTIMLFESGKMVITGARSEAQIPIAARKIYDLIEKNECWGV